MSTRSGGSFEGVHVNSFGLVIWARSFEGRSFEGRSFEGVVWAGCLGEGAPVSKMLSCDPRLALCTFVSTPSGGSFG